MPRTKRSRMAMSPVHANAAAIDIGATLHVAAVGPDRDPEPVRSFSTFTGDLHRLADWFKECGVSTVAMESTGVYWIPVFEILEQLGFTVVLVNARDAKHVPGCKTDVTDAKEVVAHIANGALDAALLVAARHRPPDAGHNDNARRTRSGWDESGWHRLGAPAPHS
jgi:transposase